MDRLTDNAPSHWSRARLGDLCEILTGPSGLALTEHTDGQRVLAPRNIGSHRIDAATTATLDPRTARDLSRYRTQTGDILLVRNGDVGRHALVTADESGCLYDSGLIRLRGREGVDNQYLYYYLGRPETREWIRRRAGGTAIPGVATSTLHDLPVLVPPREEQQLIAQTLGTLDDKIRIHEDISATTARLRATLLPLLFAPQRS